MFPHMHLRGKSFRYEAAYPNGTSETLLFVPQYDFNWQHRYVLATPKRIPAGTTLRCIAHYDNSAANPANPDPNATVLTGKQSSDEMFNGYFDVALADQDLTQAWAMPSITLPRWAWAPPLPFRLGACLLVLAVCGVGFVDPLGPRAIHHGNRGLNPTPEAAGALGESFVNGDHSEQVGVGAGTAQDQLARLLIDPVHQHPIRLDVAVSPSPPVAGKGVVTMAIGQRSAVPERFHDRQNTVHVLATLADPLGVLIVPGRCNDVQGFRRRGHYFPVIALAKSSKLS